MQPRRSPRFLRVTKTPRGSRRMGLESRGRGTIFIVRKRVIVSPREAKQVFPVGGSDRPFRSRGRPNGGGFLFRIGGQDDRPIADDALPLADGEIPRVGVAHDLSPRSPPSPWRRPSRP